MAVGHDDASANLLIGVIDDDESARDAVVGLLNALGFTAVGFESAVAFLSAGDRTRTACVISDVRMPEMTGFELHHRLVELGTPVPVILITAFPNETGRARAVRAGVRGYLQKPVRPDELLDCIWAAVANREGGNEG